ncbi:MAG: hypothetical protein H0W87_09235 [Actinobacteria bacterium]|nr:hypothetical protein [Actinomycetota bacterium]
MRTERPSTEVRKFDYPGIVTLSLAVFALLFALDQGTDWGWTDPRVLGAFVISVASLGAFVFVERRAGESALIPPDVVRSRAFTAASVVALFNAVFSVLALIVTPVAVRRR